MSVPLSKWKTILRRKTSKFEKLHLRRKLQGSGKKKQHVGPSETDCSYKIEVYET